MYRNIFSFFLLSLPFLGFGQNPIIIAPPSLVNISGVLPLPGPLIPGNDLNDPTDFYDGQIANASANGIADANGNLLFFVVDGIIYDKDGIYRGSVITDDFARIETQGNLDPNAICNYSVGYDTPVGEIRTSSIETAIVPHPECNKYYIFNAITFGFLINDVPEYPGAPLTGTRVYKGFPVYCLYNAETKMIEYQGPVFGSDSVYDDLQLAPSSSIPIFTTASTSNPLTTNGDSPAMPSFFDGPTSYAVTDILADGSRFIITQLNYEIYIIKMLPNGDLVYWKRYNNIGFYNIKRVAEMELVFNNTKNRWQLAIASSDFGQQILYQEYSPDFLAQPVSETINLPYGNSTGFFSVSGLEFSPNKRYLYVNSDVFYPAGGGPFLPVPRLNYIDTDVPILTLTGVPGTINNFWNFPMMESTNSDDFLISSADGLYVLENVNTPSALVLPTPGSPSIPMNIQKTYPSIFGLADFGMSYYPIPDQIDGMDYQAHFNTYSCCKFNEPYDKDSFASNTNYTVNNTTVNPISSTITNTLYIETELRIKRGTVATFTNMIVKFAPGAILIIEEGDAATKGGRLVLNGTTLSVDTRCSEDLFWQGVDVRGIATLVQFPFTNSKQGVLQMSNSTIEYAKVAVTNFNRQAGFSAIPNTTGGQAEINNSTFRDNATDVYYLKYTTAISASIFNGNNFITQSTLKEGAIPGPHVHIREVNGIKFVGNTFECANTAPYTLVNRGTGLYTYNSRVAVSNSASKISQFNNLYYGCNFSLGNTSSIQAAQFNECQNGLVATSHNILSAKNNIFKVQQLSSQTYGIYLNGCTGYAIEGNITDVNLPVNTTSRTVGIATQGSGTANNMIYRNFLNNMQFGILAGGVNKSPSGGPIQGLQWKCNQHKNRNNGFDFAVINGSINQVQGVSSLPPTIPLPFTYGAGNSFTLTGEPTSLTHDFFAFGLTNTPPIKYFRVLGTPTPDSYTLGTLQVLNVTLATSPVTNVTLPSAANYCPTTGPSPGILTQNITNATTDANSMQSQMDAGNTPALMNSATTAPLGVAKNNLLSAAPYVSDAILLAWLDRNPSNGHIQQVIVANSPISAAVQAKLTSMSLPNGVKNQIAAVQGNGETPLQLAAQSMSAINGVKDQYFNELIHSIVYDDAVEDKYAALNSLLSSRTEPEYKELLIQFAIQSKEFADAQTKINTLGNTVGRSQEINQIMLDQLQSSQSMCDYLNSNPSAVSTLLSIEADSAQYCVCAQRASCLLKEAINDMPLVEDFDFPMTNYSAMLTNNNQSTESQTTTFDMIAENGFNLFPNPFTNKINISLPSDFEGNFELYDLSGSRLLLATISSTNETNQTIEVENLKKGIYLVRIVSLDGTLLEVKRMLKQ